MRKQLFALLLCTCAFAETPLPVAIRNAKIVTVSGPVITRGTVVVRNGLIESVGENVTIPADAWVVEGEGLTVYPGLIDPLSTWGMPGGTSASGNGPGGRAQLATPGVGSANAERARGPEDRPATTSWILAADELQPSDRRIETARSAGFTSAVVFPKRGIFGGQGSVVDLSTNEKPGEMVVVPSVGQYLSMARSGGGFPGALMGTISYIRQIYLDAEHYKLVKDAYAKDPRGMQRPPYDRALEGVLDSRRILLPANRLVEMDRMLRFARELKQPIILYGGREAYRPEASALLKKFNAPMLVSLRWPEAPRDPNPEEDETLRTLETRDQAASAPALLKKAGVTFALYSDGLDQPRDLQRAVKKAIEGGLSREDAVRSLTLSPAEIYGVADRMGSVDKGKIGNLIVTRGDLFDDRTRIELIFVDGKKYTPVPDTGGPGRGPATEMAGGNR